MLLSPQNHLIAALILCGMRLRSVLCADKSGCFTLDWENNFFMELSLCIATLSYSNRKGTDMKLWTKLKVNKRDENINCEWKELLGAFWELLEPGTKRMYIC